MEQWHCNLLYKILRYARGLNNMTKRTLTRYFGRTIFKTFRSYTEHKAFMPRKQLPVMAPSAKSPKNTNRKQKRSLNALAIAEQQNPVQHKLRSNRLGEIDQVSIKRKRGSEPESFQQESGPQVKKRTGAPKDRFGNEIEVGSDSDGNEWVLGQVHSDEDSDIESDEAMAESDEDRFDSFTFRGSSTVKLSPKSRKKSEESNREGNLSQDLELQKPRDSQESSEGLGDDAVDLTAILDASDRDDDEASSITGSMAVDDIYNNSSSTADDLVLETDSSVDGEDPTLSVSGRETDAVNPEKLEYLRALVSRMDSKNQDMSQRHSFVSNAYETTNPSEFGISSTTKLTVQDLFPSITDSNLKKSLKLLASNDFAPPKGRNLPRKLNVPLAKRQLDRLDRAAAYAKSKETLNRWIETVKHQRRAEHILFPLQDPQAISPHGRQRLVPTTQSQPLTDLESAIHQILLDSGLTPMKPHFDDDEAFEELPKNKLSLEEVQAQTAELRRARELLFREETRAKRIKKIKSKSYRRVHRKERERNSLQEKNAMVAAGLDNSETEQERNDRRRAEERIGARHRDSKWARDVKESGKATWHEESRSAVTDMARRAEELRRRMDGKEAVIDENDSSSSDSESRDGTEGEHQKKLRNLQGRLDRLHDNDNIPGPGIKSNLSSLKFMRNADALRKARNDAAEQLLRKQLTWKDNPSEDDEIEGAGRRSYGPTKNQNHPVETLIIREQRSEFEEREGTEHDDESSQGFVEHDEQDIIVNSAFNSKPNISMKKTWIPQRHVYNHHESAKDASLENPENPWLASKKSSKKTNQKIKDAQRTAIVSNNLVVENIAAHRGGSDLLILSRHPRMEKDLKVTQGFETRLSIQDLESADENETPNRLPFFMRNQDLVRQAFAGDEVVAQFVKEKQETVRDEEEKTIDATLPGWGNWTGTGISKKERRRNMGKVLVRVEGIQKERRQDAKLDGVIINEKRIKKVGDAKRRDNAAF